MAASKIVLCTGANQGLGYAVLQVASLRYPAYTYVLASRDLEKGKAAATSLRESGVQAPIDVVQLDVTNDEDITRAASFSSAQSNAKAYKSCPRTVLINNAGIIRRPPPGDLPALRTALEEVLNTNLTSVAVVTEAFTPLLRESADPKVINVSSGLGSIQNSLTKKMGRSPIYGVSKIGLNGLTVHLQVAENDRVAVEGISDGKPRIRYYVCAPGPLKTAFTNFNALCRSPESGAEVVVRLAADDASKYDGGSFWEYEHGEMRQVPW
ncbi:hypothetical protein VPNG_06395 [Cytospora leucostoma]|uniref:Uncharacterized protein n=1 Tax=Cytospora leucostoma TaxID=1230097 RepID=A0A423WYY0_9PEZI|nr:hypothetical protein VPNG_06395 [Cytospora leucostoma]